MNLKECADAIRCGEENAAIVGLQAHPEWVRELVFEPYGDGDQWPLTVLAATFGRAKVLRALLDLGADREARAVKCDGDALDFAVSCHRPECVLLLLERGAPMTLWAAAFTNNLEEAERILAEDPEAVHRRDGADGAMPLQYAASPEMIRRLVAAGADPNAPDNAHRSPPLVWHREHADRVATLRELGADPDLHAAAVLGDVDEVSRKWEEYPQQRNAAAPGMYLAGYKQTPAGLAAVNGNIEALRWLLERGAAQHSEDFAATAMHNAAWNNQVEALRILCEHADDLNIHDRMHNATPLAWATFSGQPEAAKVLLEAGATPDDNALNNAIEGAKGAWKQFTSQPPEAFQECERLVREARDRG